MPKLPKEHASVYLETQIERIHQYLIRLPYPELRWGYFKFNPTIHVCTCVTWDMYMYTEILKYSIFFPVLNTLVSEVVTMFREKMIFLQSLHVYYKVLCWMFLSLNELRVLTTFFSFHYPLYTLKKGWGLHSWPSFRPLFMWNRLSYTDTQYTKVCCMVFHGLGN